MSAKNHPTALARGLRAWEEHNEMYYLNRDQAKEVCVAEALKGTWVRISHAGSQVSYGHDTADKS